ncbi:MAG: hypothetical protein WAK91_04055 [Candidatus Acidiferrales bacterium]|jgi:hypothetical protein
MRSTACWLLMILLFSASQPASLRSQQRPVSSSFNQSNATQSGITQSAGQPEEPPFEVPTGTRFLVALQKDMNTKNAKAGERFATRTLEPLTAPDGTFVPRGAEVRGHVSRVEAGGTTGRARIWLSFDDIQSPSGPLPIVAEVTQVPGEHSVKPGENKEGEIEARTSAGAREFQAAAAGAAIGVSAGAVKGGPKGAAMAAAVGAVAGFLAASGIGQELDLMEGTKLELELLRPLALGRR